MFRLALFRAPALSMTALAVGSRLQSSQVPVAGANRQRFRIPTRNLPKFEVHDIRDDPSQGSMVRVSVDRRQLLVSQFPQLGPRQPDPNDATSQYDSEHRVSLRFRHMDLAAMVAVTKGRLPSHHMQNRAYNLTFDKTATGFSLKGQVTRNGSQQLEDWGVLFENQFAVMLEHFLDASLTESFGFREHDAAVRRRQQNSGSDGRRRNNNNDGFRRRNNDNNSNNRRRNNDNSNSGREQRQNDDY